MKRWLVVLLVVLALIVLISPGIVGRLAEQNLKGSIGWAESQSEDFLVTEEIFQRGWFTAEGRHRIELKEGELRSAIVELTGREAAADDSIPALVVDTRIDHGLVPITSMSRASGSLMPRLASTVSTMHLDPGDGELIAVPGALYSHVGLSGETASRYLLDAGRFEDENAKVQWSGADLSVTANPSSRSMQYEGTLQPASVESDNDFAQVGLTRFSGDLRQSEYGFAVGSIKLDIGTLSLRQGEGEGVTTGFREIALDAGSEIEDGRVNAKSVLHLGGVAVPDFGAVDVDMDVTVSGLEARSTQTIIAALKARPDDPAALASAYPHIESDVQKLLSSGAEIRFDRLDVSLPQGEVTATLRFELPQTDGSAEFSWPSLLLALTASADVRLSVALMEMAQEADPQSGALVAMGILKEDGDFYVMSAQYAKGLLTVNGAPLPIPLPSR